MTVYLSKHGCRNFAGCEHEHRKFTSVLLKIELFMQLSSMWGKHHQQEYATYNLAATITKEKVKVQSANFFHPSLTFCVFNQLLLKNTILGRKFIKCRTEEERLFHYSLLERNNHQQRNPCTPRDLFSWSYSRSISPEIS